MVAGRQRGSAGFQDDSFGATPVGANKAARNLDHVHCQILLHRGRRQRCGPRRRRGANPRRHGLSSRSAGSRRYAPFILKRYAESTRFKTAPAMGTRALRIRAMASVMSLTEVTPLATTRIAASQDGATTSESMDSRIGGPSSRTMSWEPAAMSPSFEPAWALLTKTLTRSRRRLSARWSITVVTPSRGRAEKKRSRAPRLGTVRRRFSASARNGSGTRSVGSFGNPATGDLGHDSQERNRHLHGGLACGAYRAVQQFHGENDAQAEQRAKGADAEKMMVRRDLTGKAQAEWHRRW